MVVKRIFLTFILIYTFIIASSQNQMSISGKIVNKQTKEALPYVIVALNSQVGAYTDVEGSFKLTFDTKFAKDTVKISYVGYKPQKIAVSKFQKFQVLLIELVPEDYNIDNVVVQGKSQSAITILKKVNENIPNNYISRSFNYYFLLENEKIAENTKTQNQKATLIVYDATGYFKSDNVTSNKSVNYTIENLWRNYKVERITDGFINLSDVLKADIVRYNHNVLELVSLNDFDFEVIHSVYETDSVWNVKFTCKKPNIFNSGSHNTTAYTGEITINKQNYAVLKVVSQLTYSNLSPLGAEFFANNQSPYQNAKVTYSITYTKQNGKYAVNTINYSLSFTENSKIVTNNFVLKNKQTETHNLKIISEKTFFVK